MKQQKLLLLLVGCIGSILPAYALADAVFVCTNASATDFNSCAWASQWSLKDPTSVNDTDKILYCPSATVGRKDVSACQSQWTAKSAVPSDGPVATCAGVAGGSDVQNCNIVNGGGEGWQLKSVVFGSSGGATPPTLTFSASPTSLQAGGSSTLTWTSTNATSCVASNGWSGTQALNGSTSTGALKANSTFTLTCKNSSGSIARSATVNVTPATSMPTISISASPTSVSSGNSSTLTWSTTNATSCTASGAWSGSRSTAGSQSTGTLASTSTFTLSCTGAGGTTNTSATVAVASAPIVTISASPSSVTSGSSSVLTWNSTNATSCLASGAWSGSQSTSGSMTISAISSSSTYALTCTGTGGTGSNSTTISVAAGTGTFPLAHSANNRYLQDQSGKPWPILGRASWYVLSLSTADYQSYLQDTIAKGFNAIEVKLITHDPGSNHPPFAGNGAAPFTKRLDGSAWSGSLTYSNINTEVPDFTTPNEAYWSFVDAFVDYCEANGILILGFPAYVGYTTTPEGYMAEMVANGTTKMQAYGAWVANRYKNKHNIVWMLGGDNGNFDASQTAVEGAFITGMKSVAGQASTQYSAEWTGRLSTDQPDFGGEITLNGVYQYYNMNYVSRLGYARSPTMPCYWMEGTYEDSGSPLATTPMRKYQIWAMLSTISGYVSGNTVIWRFNSGYTSALNSPMVVDLARFNTLIKSIAWYRLVPDGLGSIGTIVTAGGGSQDDITLSDMVTAAATPEGDLLIAYIGPGHTGSVTIDMTKLRGTATAKWWNPTDGTYTAIGTFPNTGTHAFTTPGNHADGSGDWILRIDAP